MAHAIRSLLRHHGGPEMGGLTHHPAIYDAVATADRVEACIDAPSRISVCSGSTVMRSWSIWEPDPGGFR